jgi:hypothetical protein
MIRRPGDRTYPRLAARDHQGRKWVLASMLIVAVTWIPVLAVHLHRTSVGDRGTGTVIVVFSPTRSSRELFRSVAEASGSLVRPVPWLPRAWVARSLEPGFAGRLREHGAWGVYSADLLSARALLSCLRFSGPEYSSAAPASLPAS